MAMNKHVVLFMPSGELSNSTLAQLIINEIAPNSQGLYYSDAGFISL